ncbi:uncharacterized protein TNIN_109021 [Trichonephila inaurata madagascariensis]|uniref:Uncharacterized protein n=1 Tax=Trichonephila inaurata madagascariensis TaxID=2747483 RepID=A0A8X6XC54_9ARAC|nr:uncharacterized protein TNIN_109021 [Trichonephila inaurata madagascariensis]
MHRFYQPLVPSTNLFLKHKWDFIDYEVHRQNLKIAKAKIDQKAPRIFTHLYIRPKRLQLNLDRFCTIQRQNKDLLEKIMKIQRFGGWTDNKNFSHQLKSIHTVERQREAVRLISENISLLSRIQDRHAAYNRSEQESYHCMQKKYQANIDRFPRNWREMRDDMKYFRTNIRRKYIYPRFGIKKKGSKEKELIKEIMESDEVVEILGKMPEKKAKTLLERVLSIYKLIRRKKEKEIETEDEQVSSDTEDQIQREIEASISSMEPHDRKVLEDLKAKLESKSRGNKQISGGKVKTKTVTSSGETKKQPRQMRSKPKTESSTKGSKMPGHSRSTKDSKEAPESKSKARDPKGAIIKPKLKRTAQIKKKSEPKVATKSQGRKTTQKFNPEQVEDSSVNKKPENLQPAEENKAGSSNLSKGSKESSEEEH